VSTAAAAAGRRPEGSAAWESVATPVLNDSPSTSACSQVIETHEIVRMLRECGLSAATVAWVIGTTKGRLAAWERSSRPPEAGGLQNLGRILEHFLKRTAMPRDVGRWLCTPNRHLRSRRPIELLARGWVAEQWDRRGGP
jgi:DNA-binding transcriptional regulator YiaG